MAAGHLQAAAVAQQSDRIGTRRDERLGGPLNDRSTPQVKGLYGPDPYVVPGSVSPFTRAPVVPLRSAPNPSPEPYAGRPPIEIDQAPAANRLDGSRRGLPSARPAEANTEIQGETSSLPNQGQVGQRLSPQFDRSKRTQDGAEPRHEGSQDERLGERI